MRGDHRDGPDARTRRDVLKAAGMFAGAGLWPEMFVPLAAGWTLPVSATSIGRAEILMGLDGMSRVAEEGNDPFADGHRAAAVLSSAFFCRENELDEETQAAISALMRARLLGNPLFAPRPEEP